MIVLHPDQWTAITGQTYEWPKVTVEVAPILPGQDFGPLERLDALLSELYRKQETEWLTGEST